MSFYDKEEKINSDWLLFEKGKDYNRMIGLYETINKNERFWRGDQWNGVRANGLPTPVFNVYKRVISYLVSAIASEKLSFKISIDGIRNIFRSDVREDVARAASLLTSYLNYRYEKDGVQNLISKGLLDAALTGDMFLYVWWDKDKKTSQSYMGDFATKLIDSSNVFFGNVNDPDVQSQPYIIISGRDLVENLRAEAKENGAGAQEIKAIVPDRDTDGMSGDFASCELADTKCTYIIKLYKKEGTVRYRKCTKHAVICQDVDTGLKLYPLCLMNWQKVKNSYHGWAAGTGLIDNQLYINKAFAMVMKHMLNVSFSKVVYNANVVDEWTNTIGEAIAVYGDVEGVAKTIDPGQMQPGFLEVISLTTNMTKELMGASDAALGNLELANNSAIVSLQQASSIQLESQRRALYEVIEALGLIWIDFILHYYDGGRILFYREKEELLGGTFDTSRYADALFVCNIDVGMSSYWSELASINTLDNLLSAGHISFAEYLERIPDGYVPGKQELLRRAKKGGVSDDCTGSA